MRINRSSINGMVATAMVLLILIYLLTGLLGAALIIRESLSMMT